MSDNEKGYAQKVVCFIDILGFKEIVNNKSKNEISKIFDHLETLSKTIKKDAKMLDRNIPKITYFSDSVIISYDTVEKNQLVFIIMNLRNILIYLLKKHILVRGSITKGGLLHSDSRIYGPALNDAHILESTIAIYPRIIISRDVLWDENFITEFENLSKQNLMNCIAVDMDGWHYIDFIQSPNEFSLFSKYLMTMSNILKLITEHKAENLKMKTKYGWLNMKASQSLNHIYEDDLSIDEKKQLSVLKQECVNNGKDLYSRSPLS